MVYLRNLFFVVTMKKQKFYNSLIPFFAGILNLLIYSNNQYPKVNLYISISIILVSFLNMLFSNKIELLRQKFEIVHILLLLSIAGQFLMNVNQFHSLPGIFQNIINYIKIPVTLSCIPIIISIITDLGIISLLNRNHAIIFKAMNSLLVIVLMSVFSRNLKYNPFLMGSALIIPSFVVMCCLPTENMKDDTDKKNQKNVRIICLISTLIIAFTCFSFAYHTISQRMSMKAIISSSAKAYWNTFCNAIVCSKNFIFNQAYNLKKFIVYSFSNICEYVKSFFGRNSYSL